MTLQHIVLNESAFLKVKQLNDLGASAIQIDNSTMFSDVSAGSFRFGGLDTVLIFAKLS